MITNECINDIIIKYILLINNYSNFFYNNINIYKDINYFENLYVKGLVVIQNIFNVASLYLDNISDICNLCEKGYIYFIEFINQLNISNTNENSLDLTLRDAVIFSYKKTIFYLENKIKIDISENEKELLILLNLYCYIINNINIILNRNIYSILNKIDKNCNDFNENINNKKSDINLILKNSNSILLKLIKKLNNNLNINLSIQYLLEIKVYLNNIQYIVNNFNKDFINLINNKVCYKELDEKINIFIIQIEKIITKKKYCNNIQDIN